MKIPKKLKIGGHWYTVKYPYEFTERGDIDGQQDSDALLIKVSDKDSWSHQNRPKSRVAVVFLHEILHACDSFSGHKIFKDKEGAIEAFGEILFQVLRDNKLHFEED